MSVIIKGNNEKMFGVIKPRKKNIILEKDLNRMVVEFSGFLKDRINVHFLKKLLFLASLSLLIRECKIL